MTARFRQCRKCPEWIELELVPSGQLLCAPCKLTEEKAKAVLCGECGSPMVLRKSTKYLKNGGLFWGCSQFPKCRGTHGAHADGKPMGIPTDKSTKKARMEAHEAFDTLWKTGRMTRPQAYQVMQELMGMTEAEAHIARFNREQCSRLVSLILLNYPPLS